MSYKLVFILAAAMLPGCVAAPPRAGPPVVKMATPLTVMIESVDKYNAMEALELAESECQKHGRHAIHVPDSQRDYVASYECKD